MLLTIDTPYELGIAGLMFLIIASLIKVISYYAQQKRPNGQEKVNDVVKQLSELKVRILAIEEISSRIKEELHELREAHLGEMAFDKIRNVPKWWLTSDIEQQVSYVYELCYKFVGYSDVFRRYCLECTESRKNPKCIVGRFLMSLQKDLETRSGIIRKNDNDSEKK